MVAPRAGLALGGPHPVAATPVPVRPRRWAGRVALLGPAFVASVAYTDPGNFVTNIQAGAGFGYLLLWCVLGASLLAMPVQYLAAKVGLVTGMSLPELCRRELSRPVAIVLWAQAELVAMCTDIAEFVGAAIGLNLLFAVPLTVAAAITAVVAFLVLGLQRRGGRRFEAAIAAAVGLVTAGFAYQTVRTRPSAAQSLYGLVPHLAGDRSLVIAVGIVGATVMPHAVYLHSGLTRDRARGASPARRLRLLAAQRADVLLALGLAGGVNMAMLAVAARLFHRSQWGELSSLAQTHAGLAHLAGGGVALTFACALFASGASSSTVGTYAGQVIMDGFTGRSVPITLRRALTMAPAVALLAAGADPTAALLDSQIVLSFGIPFALVPLVWFSARRSVMGEHANSAALTAVAVGVAAVITALDAVLVVQQVL